ncbi:uncharacterized protein [Cicer arietinum]|uniref:uncharacterized protein n=1 Tax=Cicer arietinum TaxID=3827 RepID=UPI003CC63A79
MKFLGEAVGSYVTWPTHLVVLNKILKKPKGNNKKISRNESITSPEKIQSNKPLAQQNKASKPQKLEGNKAGKLQKVEGNKAAKVAAKKLDRGKSIATAPNISQPCLAKYGSCLDIQVKKNMGSNDDSRIISMNKAIFGDEYEEFLEKEHIYELLNHKERSAIVISLYIRFLYEMLVCTHRLSNRYSFLSLHKLSMRKLDPVNVKKYIVDILLGNIEKDKLFFAPYNSGTLTIPVQHTLRKI